MATTAQLNAVFDAVKADAKQLVDELVPFLFRGSAEAQLTVDRVLKIARDAVAAYERTIKPVPAPTATPASPPGAKP